MDVAITGASGLIGTALRASLEADGHRVSAARPPGLGRVGGHPPGTRRRHDRHRAAWRASTPWSTSPARASRRAAGPRSTRTPCCDSRRRRAPRSSPKPWPGSDAAPGLRVSGSAIGYYGRPGRRGARARSRRRATTSCRASASPGRRPPRPAEDAGIRGRHIRTGIVLVGEGGALAQAAARRSGWGWAGKAGRGDAVDVVDPPRRRGRRRSASRSTTTAVGAANLVAPAPGHQRRRSPRRSRRSLHRPTVPARSPGSSRHCRSGSASWPTRCCSSSQRVEPERAARRRLPVPPPRPRRGARSALTAPTRAGFRRPSHGQPGTATPTSTARSPRSTSTARSPGATRCCRSSSAVGAAGWPRRRRGGADGGRARLGRLAGELHHRDVVKERLLRGCSRRGPRPRRPVGRWIRRRRLGARLRPEMMERGRAGTASRATSW